jgi:hypothetical protein
MSLREQITADMKEAMRARDTARLETVRLLRAAIQRREIDEHIELDDDKVLSVIQKMIKQGRDSIKQFEKGHRQDLVEKELVMVRLLEAYVPEALSDSELISLIDKALNEVKAQSIKDMGSVMGFLKTKIRGRADMSTVSTLVREKLNS